MARRIFNQPICVAGNRVRESDGPRDSREIPNLGKCEIDWKQPARINEFQKGIADFGNRKQTADFIAPRPLSGGLWISVVTRFAKQDKHPCLSRAATFRMERTGKSARPAKADQEQTEPLPGFPFHCFFNLYEITSVAIVGCHQECPGRFY